jgi:prolyl 4-hydroxylase
MKSEYFLVLPLAATVLNVFVVLFLRVHHNGAAAAQPILQGDVVAAAADRRISLLDGYVTADGRQVVVQEEEQQQEQQQEEVEKDPMLQLMPDWNVEAYVRADVSTFHREEPGTLEEKVPSFRGQAGKFVNMSPESVGLYWDGPSGPVYHSVIGPWGSGGTACFPTHRFIFTRPDQPDSVLCRFTIRAGTSVYYCDPYSGGDGDDERQRDDEDPARGEVTEPWGRGKSLADMSADDRASRRAHLVNLEFGAAYKNFTGGAEWLAMYPPSKPRHRIWRADYLGQEHTVATEWTQFWALPVAAEDGKRQRSLSVAEMRDDDRRLSLAEYRTPGTMNLTLKAVSCAPRAFQIEHFLSDAEVDHVLELVRRKNLVRSTTGSGSDGSVSETRTSSTTWLSRHSDPVLNVIFKRAADALRLDEALLRDRGEEELPDSTVGLGKINEDLQIVHYDRGQQYTAHHDFSYPKTAKADRVRAINLCMYLNDVPSGGQTSFPRWRNAETTEALDVTPVRGKAMIFYMLLPDGNLDDLSQHAALPVIEGEKYFANLWISSY